MKRKPDVSIIIPFRENRDELRTMLKAIAHQDFPQHAMEVICVDNGDVQAPDFAHSFSPADDPALHDSIRPVFISERQHPGSPYSARNRGIEQAKGEILVFADANSVPDKNWLKEGLWHIQHTGAGIVAGRVGFHYGNKKNGAKITDALTSIDQKKAVEERGVAYTANLFVRREIFRETGYFEEGVRSGGDVRWTTKAVAGGARIEYCDHAVVYKYARSARQLYKKRIRTGSGYYYTWKEERNRKKWWYNFIRSLKPPNPRTLKTAYSERYGEPLTHNIFSVWFFSYSSAILEQLAFLKEYSRRHPA